LRTAHVVDAKDKFAVMDETLPARLLEHLRANLGTEVAFAVPPIPFSGGFDTTTAAFSLSGAPPEYSCDLVLRLMPQADQGVRVTREAATHAALVAEGFPAPRVLMMSADPAALGRPFLIMERLEGDHMFANIFGRNGRIGRITGLSRTLADVQLRLHDVPGDCLHTSARKFGLDRAIFTVDGVIQRLAWHSERAGLTSLVASAAWLAENRPAPAMAEVICHGDLHPLNVVMAGDELSGVVDWSQAIAAEPAYDVAATRVLMQFGPVDVAAWLRPVVDRARAIPIRRYLRFYRAARPFDERNMAYYESLRVFFALVDAGTTLPGRPNAWGAPHTLAALYRHFERITGVRARLH
jgi:aminoglycoside phosphotransferase (APT) family kinase protein